MVANKHDWDGPVTEHTGVFPIEIVDDNRPIAVSARLVCVAGEDLGKTFRIAKFPLLIGRGGAADLSLSSTDVSRRHALLFLDEGSFVLQDLGSVNGTFVNTARIDREASLQLGDRIQIGNTVLLLAPHDELEARMQQLQRVEAMSAMASGLAHDFRNALAVILAGLDTFGELLAEDAHELRDVAKDMGAATTAAVELAKRLTNIGRREMTAHDRVNVLDVVEQTLAMARHLTGKRIALTVDIAQALVIRGSRDELQQVIMNLLVNAKDAMPQGGIVSITGELVQLERAPAHAYHLPDKGRYVELRIRDTGQGMDEATLSRAFEPFFTTKAPGLGTGLGLAITYGIVKRHGGSILVESARGRGTTFRILLPAADEKR